MNEFTGNPEGDFVATIGVFDGVHLGHQALIDATIAEARRRATPGRSVRSCLITFDPHPAAVLAPGRVTSLLTPTPEKLRLVRARGIEDVRVLAFDRQMAALEPEEFLSRHVDQAGGLRHLVIGHDFALGRNRVGDEPRLARIGRERGFGVTRFPAVRLAGQVLSSTRVRQELARGDMAALTALLGRPYSLEGVVGPGDGRGRTIGVPTANVALPPEKTPPPLGVYAVRAFVAEGGSHPAVMNFGSRPTFGGGDPVVEVHLLDYSGDLNGRPLRVDLIHWVREERRFPGPESLVAQIRADMAAARELLRG